MTTTCRGKGHTLQAIIADAFLSAFRKFGSSNSRDWGSLRHQLWHGFLEGLFFFLFWFRLLTSLAGLNRLRGAVGDLAVLDKTFNQPVFIIETGHTGLDTLETQVVVAVVTYAAMIVLVRDGAAAVVAVNAEDSIGRCVRHHWHIQAVLTQDEVTELRLSRLRGRPLGGPRLSRDGAVGDLGQSRGR